MLNIDPYILLRRLIVQNFFNKLSYRFQDGSLQIELGARMISGLRSYMTSPYQESVVLIAGGQVFVLPGNNCKATVEKLDMLTAQAKEVSIGVNIQFVDFDTDNVASESKTVINCKPHSFMVQVAQTADLIPGEVSPEDTNHRVLYAPGAGYDDVPLEDVEQSDRQTLVEFAALKRYDGMALIPHTHAAQGKLKQFNAVFVDVGVMTNHYHLYKYIVYHRETPSLKLTFYSAVIVVNALQKQQILQVFDPLLGATSVRLDQIVFEKQE